MIGGLLKSTSSLAIVAAAGMFIGGLTLTPAQAADLGGDCCADLEERVADLEATTARKGNRKVSLKISGHVARTFGWYEDEDGDSEFYSAGLGVSGSRLQFSGSAKLTSNWTAGYVLRMRLDSDRNLASLGFAGESAGNPGATRQNVAIDKNYVYLKHAQLGTVAFGNVYAPTSGVTTISLGGFGVTADAGANDWNASGINGFDLDQDSSGHQAIAYISPTIAGFTLAVAWADLDLPGDPGVDAIDVALRYANEFGPIRVAAGIGYTTVDEDDDNGTDVEGANVMGSVALLHTPTGLNVNFAAGTEIDGGLLSAPGDNSDREFWYVAGGINKNFFGMGNTSIYGEYGDYDSDDAAIADVEMWGLGIVQHFDSAATELFLSYRNWEQDNIGSEGEVQQIQAGMRIKF